LRVLPHEHLPAQTDDGLVGGAVAVVLEASAVQVDQPSGALPADHVLTPEPAQQRVVLNGQSDAVADVLPEPRVDLVVGGAG
jgi:hypothetical protein